MTSLLLVRHAEPAAGFGDATDPGLSAAGVAHAAELAERLSLQPRRPIFSSPLQRARQTAQPLADQWDVSVAIAPVLRELPSPTTDLAERAEWLGPALGGNWADLGPDVGAWRRAILDAAVGVEFPQVWFTHFVVMNAVVSAVLGSDRVTVFRPGHCAVLELEVVEGEVSIVTTPGDAESAIR